MKTKFVLLVGLITSLTCITSNASITNAVYWDDMDGYLGCSNVWYDYDNVNIIGLNMSGNQYLSPGHMVGTLYADSAADPTIAIRNAVDNDTAFPWTAFHVNVYLSQMFTLSGATNYVPGDWTTSITAPVNTGTNWMGQVDFYGGTTVNINDTLDFGYTMSFSGLTSYSICQEFIPIPEPGTFSLVLVGGLLLGGFKVARRRRSAAGKS